MRVPIYKLGEMSEEVIVERWARMDRVTLSVFSFCCIAAVMRGIGCCRVWGGRERVPFSEAAAMISIEFIVFMRCLCCVVV